MEPDLTASMEAELASELSMSALEVVLSYRAQARPVLHPGEGSAEYVSFPLPTRRFGPPSFVSFRAAKPAGQSTVGPFRAWILFDKSGRGLLGYLEAPLALSFGTVPEFEMPEISFESLQPNEIAALGLAAQAFLDQEEPGFDHSQVGQLLAERLSPSALGYAQVVAPDFFAWLMRRSQG